VTTAAAGLVAAMVLLGADSTYPTLLSRGQTALKAEDYPAAQMLLEKAVALRPDDAESHYLLGRAYGQDKKYQFAAQQFRETLKLSPGHTQALIDLGTIEETMGRLDEAEARYRQALRAGPNPRAQRGLASLLTKQGRREDAVKALREALAAAPADTETRYQLGLALMQEDDCAGAVPEFRAVIQKETAHLGSLFNLGNCLNRTGHPQEAEVILERFRKESQEASEHVDRRRRAYFLNLEADRRLEAKDAAGAVASLRQAMELAPEDAGTHALMGQALEAGGDVPGALAAYRRASELDPTDTMTLVEVGRLLGRSGRFADAVPYLKKAAQIDPFMPEPHLFLAAAYQQLGRSMEAQQEQALYRRLAAKH